MNPENKDIYEQFSNSLVEFKETQFEKVNIETITQNKIDIDVFYFTTSNLILSHLLQKNFIESPIYRNFFKNICIPLFKNKGKIFDAIKILYEPQRCKKLIDGLGINEDNLNIILHSYRYFINELNSNSQNNSYSVFYSRRVEKNKIDKGFYPGNDIKDIPIYSIYSKIVEHFQNKPNEGCFVCLCKNGGYYHSIKGEVPDQKYLNLKCNKCGSSIGAFRNTNNRIAPIKREDYYRIFKSQEGRIFNFAISKLPKKNR
jgi:hypothetical protein